MPKPTDYDKTHLRNMAAIGTRIDRIFKKAAEEAAKIGVSIKTTLPEDRIFSFDDYPATKKQIERLMTALQESMETTIVSGVQSAWTLSNNKNNALVSRIFGDRVGELSKEQYRRYFSTNGADLDAFLQRKEKGLNLSDRVWRYTDAFKREIELGLDLGIRTGESAAQMSRSLRQYLQHPDKLFRRVRDKHGNLRLSQAARDFHPGRGVYRSSYKNARRLACTETNMAYRTSDHLRWQQMEFVVGIEIKLSNNHTLNGVPLTDICDTLAGRYPKDFKFTGWHPHCRCHVVTVLKTEEEMAEDTKRILAGQQPLNGSENAVTDVPEAFKSWVEGHADRIEMGGNLPYFIVDNPKYTDPGWQPSRFFNAEDYAAIQENFFGAISIIRMREILLKEGFTTTEWDEMSRLIDLHRHGGENQADIDIQIALEFRDPNSRLGAMLRMQSEIEEEAYRIYRMKHPPMKVYRAGDMSRDTFSFTMKEGGVTKMIEGEEVRWGANIKTTLDELLKDNHLAAGLMRSDIGYSDELELFFISKKPKVLTNEFVTQWKAEQVAKTEEAIRKQALAAFIEMKNEVAGKLMSLMTKSVPMDEILQLQKEFMAVADGDMLSLSNFKIKISSASRHAARTPQQIEDIKKAWEAKQKRDATTKLIANNILKLRSEYPRDVDFSVLEKLIADNNLTKMREEAKNVAQAIKAVRDEEKALSLILDNAHDWHKTYSLSELKQVYDAVENKLTDWEMKGIDIISDPDKLKSKLEFEIQWLEKHKKHSTWQVAQDAYKKKLAEVETHIELTKLNAEYTALLGFKTTSKDFKAFMAKAKAAIDTGDVKTAKSYIASAQWKKKTLEHSRKGKSGPSIKSTSSQFGDDAYSQKRKDAAMWAQDTEEADKRLRGKCGEVWRGASSQERGAIYGYTQSYCNINEPLRGLTYCGSATKKAEGLRRIPHIESIIDRSSYDFDMWLQCGDGLIALKKFGLTNWSNPTDADIMALLGAEGVEGAFWSAGVAKGKGFSGDIIFNIYAPRGTKAMYCEPFSAYGRGSGRNWDGIAGQSSYGHESEILIQRGTKFKITKIEKSGGTWYIDVDIIEQHPVTFPYVGGYPFK